MPFLLNNILSALFLLMTACSSAPEKAVSDMAAPTDGEQPPLNVGKPLIVYLSRTSNTKAIAEIIQRNVGGELVALELENPYPANYQAIVQQVAKENETGFLPPLKTKIDNLQQYTTVFVGFPTWGMQLPPPIKSFLKQYDLGGKTIVPFNTNAGYGIGSSFDTVKALCPNSTVKKGFSTKGGIERDGIYFVMEGQKQKQAESEIKKWLQSLSLTEK